MKPPSPAYQFTVRALKESSYISVHSCLTDFIDSEPKGWVDTEQAKDEIEKALMDYRYGKL